MSNLEFIKDCQEKVFSGERISVEEARKLFTEFAQMQHKLLEGIEKT